MEILHILHTSPSLFTSVDFHPIHPTPFPVLNYMLSSCLLFPLLTALIMSTFTVLGFLALAQGCRVMFTCPGTNTRTWHAHYITSLQCVDGATLPADLHVYSQMNDILHPDNTITFVHARAHIGSNRHIKLNASHLICFLGDPENSIPDFPYPLIIALGNVSS